jgi:hypothetical protein
MSDPVNAAFDSDSLATLAQQLRDGPLQELTELHRRTALLSTGAAVDQHKRLQQLTELALVSLSAMEHFHAFTRELRAQIAALTTPPPRELH